MNVRIASVILLTLTLFNTDLLSQSTTSILDNWCFQYKYDSHKRMTHKKAPGADWIYMVYDDRDRLVMTQDGNQRSGNQWTFTRYDALNRPIITGIYKHTQPLDQAGMSALINPTIFSETFDGTNTCFGYTNTVMVSSSFAGSFEPLTITYYDNYDFIRNDPYFASGPSPFPRVTGMITGTWTRILGKDRQWLRSVNYYDDNGRLVQTISDNHKRGQDVTANVYDFTGKVTASKTTSVDHKIAWSNVASSIKVKEDRLVNGVNTAANQAAISAQQIPVNSDGWVEFTCSTFNKAPSLRWFGLSTGAPASINYCVQQTLVATSTIGSIQAQENGVSRSSVIVVDGGDVVRIERRGMKMYYSKNGVVFWTTALTSRPALNAHAALTVINSELYNPRISVAGTMRTVEKHFEYDHAGRLIKTWHSVDGRDSILIAKNDYNELGQLIDKKLHSDDTINFRQSLDYRYNIRGWLLSSNGAQLNAEETNSRRDLFGFDLFYNDFNAALNNHALSSGNISAMRWSNDLGLSDIKERAYKFDYDPMSRLTSAVTSSGTNREFGITYDMNGNIKTLLRTDDKGILIDSLKYNYGSAALASNILRRLSDSGTTKGFTDTSTSGDDYAYDKNGNMTLDKNKKVMSIAYNHLNLPERVTKNTGDYVSYTYDATGKKLIQDVYSPTNILKKRSDYRGEWFYENDTLRFVSHNEGRVVMTGAEPEYQYHLKDHLGNVRLTFTTKDDVDVSTTYYETPTADFLYYNEAVKINSTIFDHTDSGSTHYSARLNGSIKERFGLAKSLSVMPGDTITMEVFAKYLDTNSNNWTSALAALITSIGDGTAVVGTFIDGGAVGSTGGVAIPWSGFLDKSSQTTMAPKAYLNYVIFDRDYNFLTGNFVPLSTAAREYGQDGAHERLACDLPIKTAGYVYIYLSNDNVALGGRQVEVYFDDFKVVHIKSPVVQSQDYYPFGMVMGAYGRENRVTNRFKFQSQEHIDDLGLEWDSFKWRNHQSDIGRFFNIDPLAYKYVYNSPYAFSENHVIAHVELEGLEMASINHDGLEEALNRAATNTTTVLRMGSSIKISSQDANGNEMNSTTIVLPSNDKQGEVSDKSAKAIGEVAMTVNDKKIVVSSVRRNASEQGRAMMQNLTGTGRAQGVVAQRSLYQGKPGEQVVNTFVKYKALQGIASQFGGRITNGQIQNALTSKINELGVHNVTNHASLDRQLNVIDISPRSVENNQGFVDAAMSHPSVEKFIPYTSDPGNHFEIKN
ncbi:MAG: hypothetical protein WDO15_15790 [Bacteroidota bacterium]